MRATREHVDASTRTVTRMGGWPPGDLDPPLEMDRSYYIEDEIFEQEMEKVLARSWLFVGHESEIPSPGDYMVRPMGQDSVIVTRDEHADVHVLLNSCMHRGNVLCKAAFGNTSHFRCSYHGWTYGNDGTLRAVPGVRDLYGKDFDKKGFTLPEAPSAMFHGLVFATWNKDAPSLDEYLGGIKWYFDAMWGLSKAGIEVYGQAHRVSHKGNWKLPQENGSGDGYHLQWTHRTAFELGLFGPQAQEAMGHVVNTPEGHALRCQHPVLEDAERPFWGYPEDRWPEIRENLSPDQVKFFGGSSVIHGGLFPSCIFVHVAPPHGLDPEDQQTAFFQWRLHNPISATETEEWYWLFVPKDYTEEWKQSSYKLMHRQHGAGAFFESDDIENFRRINAATLGPKARSIPFNYELGYHVPSQEGDGWDGPGNIVPQDFTEANQRAFYRRYLELMST
jgi:PAH dioxygenase large subunit